MAKLLIEMVIILFIMMYGIISLGKYIDNKIDNPHGVLDFIMCSLILVLISVIDVLF